MPDSHPFARRGATLLAGGSSSRMGQPKWALPFGPERMLDRVVRLLAQSVQKIVVVAPAGESLPNLPPGVLTACDRRPGLGPLEGLAVGLAQLPAGIEAAFATGCDAPLLVPAFIDRLFELLNSAEAAVPVVDSHRNPLAAVYCRSASGPIERMLVAGQRRVQDLCDVVPTRLVTAEELRAADPELLSLVNLNTPDDYQRALERAGFAGPRP